MRTNKKPPKVVSKGSTKKLSQVMKGKAASKTSKKKGMNLYYLPQIFIVVKYLIIIQFYVMERNVNCFYRLFYMHSYITCHFEEPIVGCSNAPMNSCEIQFFNTQLLLLLCISLCVRNNWCTSPAHCRNLFPFTVDVSLCRSLLNLVEGVKRMWGASYLTFNI